MARRQRSRVLSSLLGVWFLVAGQEPPFPHPCEMGGMATHVEHSAPSERSGHADHSEHGAHTPAPAEHAGHQESGAPEDPAPTGTCECIGDCCGVPVPDAPTAEIVVAAIVQQAQAAAICATRQHIATATPYALPFANGPPQA